MLLLVAVFYHRTEKSNMGGLEARKEIANTQGMEPFRTRIHKG